MASAAGKWLAKKAGKALLKKAAVLLGGAAFFWVVLVLVVALGIYGVAAGGDFDADNQVSASDQKARAVWERAAAKYSPPVQSPGGEEEALALSWADLGALETCARAADLKESGTPASRAEESARALAPRFQYRDSEVTVAAVKDDGTRDVKTYPVKLLVRADTYRGVYTYRYRTETQTSGNVTVTREVVSGVDFARDFSRLDAELKKRMGVSFVSDLDRKSYLEAAAGMRGGTMHLGWFFGQDLNPAFVPLGQIPPDLMELFRRAEAAYGVPWYVLAAIAKVESDFRPDCIGPPNPSGELAVGMMQFLPSTFRAFAVDGNGDGRTDPMDPADAVMTAARYLASNGAPKKLEEAVFLYNHSDAYVAKVMALADSYRVQSAGGSLGYYPPLPVALRVTSCFGEVSGIRNNVPHRGLDLAAPLGTPVQAVIGGTATTSTSAIEGNMVTVAGDDGRTYYYMHLAEFAVASGQRVSAGQLLGHVGMTGRTTGPHLHLGVKSGGAWVDPLVALGLRIG